MNDPRAIPDPETALDLGAGWCAAWCIEREGQSWPWLLAPDDDGMHGCSCRDCAPHEQPGHPIPEDMLAALRSELPPLPSGQQLPARCGRPRRDGSPCRTPVIRPGLACRWHRERTTHR